MRKTSNIVFILFALLCALQSIAQSTQQEKLDSLRQKLKKDSAWIFRYRKVAPLIGLDNRNTFIQHNAPVNLYGVQLGVVLHERHQLALGGYQIKSSAKRAAIKGDKNKTENVDLDMQYLTLFYQYNFIHTRWFEIGAPVEAGFGRFTINVSDSAGHALPGFPHTRGITPVGIGLDFTFFPLRWLGLNAMGGYRKVFDNERRLNFSGAFYSYGIAIDFGYWLNRSFYFFKKRKYHKSVKRLCEAEARTK